MKRVLQNMVVVVLLAGITIALGYANWWFLRNASKSGVEELQKQITIEQKINDLEKKVSNIERKLKLNGN